MTPDFRPARPPAHAVIVPLAAGCFFAALVADVIYLKTAGVQWETFSVWLIVFGLVLTAVSALVLLLDVLVGGRRLTLAWGPFLAGALAAVLSIVNVFVHSRDGYTAVAGAGITLSVVVALILLFMGWNRWTLTRLRASDR